MKAASRRVWKRRFKYLAVVFFPLFTSVANALADPALVEAEGLYQQTKYSDALGLLEKKKEKTGVALALIGKCYYGMGQYKKATEALEEAVKADPRSSHYLYWLGKAYGMRADTSSFLTAPAYASKTRRYIEQAVTLDPTNWDAVDDLFEYYLEAPGFLGGGQDKALRLAEGFRNERPAQYHFLMARFAEKKKEWQEAEQHWRQAAEVSGSDEGLLLGLAGALTRLKRHAESDEVFDQAEKIAPGKARVKFERAKAYIESNRHPAAARKLLQEYLRSSLTPEDPPRSEAERLLEKIVRN